MLLAIENIETDINGKIDKDKHMWNIHSIESIIQISDTTLFLPSFFAVYIRESARLISSSITIPRSSNSVISQDSVKMDGALIYTQSFDGDSFSMSWMYVFNGIVNATLDEMEGDQVLISTIPNGAWHATKIQQN